MSSGKALCVNEALQQSIKRFFDDYAHALSIRNAETVVSFFAMPFYVELNGDPVVWTAAEKQGSVTIKSW